MADFSLAEAARVALSEADPYKKAARTHDMARRWRELPEASIGTAPPPDRPGRPARPELRLPRDMPRRGRAGSPAGRVALLHAIAHIELNAVDLACDILCRFTYEPLPRSFYDDWVRVADEEATHFELLIERLDAMGAAYGDLPAHDGLWQSAQATAHDLLARLAIVPLVLEARGLDVTPAMIASLEKVGDADSVAVLRIILRDEIGHVAAGQRWFEHICHDRGAVPVTTFQELVRTHFKGALKAPFNRAARDSAGLTEAFYKPLADR